MIIYPNSALRTISQPLKYVVPSIRPVIERMRLEQRTLKGCGISAIQINIPYQVMIVQDEVIIDPVILEQSKEQNLDTEGCLSIPGAHAKVLRPNTVIAMFLNEQGKQDAKTFEGFDARIFMHEYDHLQGKLFIDLLTKSNRKQLLKDY